MGAEHSTPPTICGIRNNCSTMTQTHKGESNQFIRFIDYFTERKKRLGSTPFNIIRKNNPPADGRYMGNGETVVFLRLDTPRVFQIIPATNMHESEMGRISERVFLTKAISIGAK